MRANLINKRKEAKYTQKELSKLLNITENQYQRLEAGSSDGSVKLWQKLSSLLNNTSINCLLEQVDSKSIA